MTVNSNFVSEQIGITSETENAYVLKKVSSPVDAVRTGVTFLVAYPLAIQPDRYHEVSVDDYSWLSSVVKRGEVKVTEKDITEFFSVVEDGNDFFAVDIDGEKKFFEIEFREPSISPNLSYIKLYKLGDVPTTSKDVGLENRTWLENAVDNEFRWIQVDDQSALEMKQLMADKESHFRILMSDGTDSYYDVRYTGPQFDTEVRQ